MTAADRLATERNLWLATVRPDGRPHLVPVWFVAVGEQLWVGTGAASVKVANLVAEPRAVVALEDGNDPLVAEVTARIADRPWPPAVVDAFARKYGWDVTVEVDDDLGTVALVEVSVVRWVLGRPDGTGPG
jgi:predicted pyridoxine 5'-phosphate oxidase superfamily flavin-nucleotide-binding protein